MGRRQWALAGLGMEAGVCAGQDGGWKHPPFTRQVSPTVLAKSVLAEVPGQLVEYCSPKELPP